MRNSLIKNFIRISLLVLAMVILASEAHSGQLQLTWTDNSANEDGFKIERKTGATGTYAEIATVGVNVTSYTNSSLVDGTTYCFRVRAYNSAGNSLYTPEACGTVVAPVQNFTLTVVKSGTGNGTVTATGINCGAGGTDCTEVFSGNRVLTATASAGSMFSGWSGGGCSGAAATCTVNVTANTTVTATFSTQPVQTFTLTVVKAGAGTGTVTATGVACGADCSEVLPSGSSRQLTALADAGSTFSGWSGGGCSGTGACTVTLSANTTVTATFALQPAPTFTLTVAKSGEGTVTATGINCGADCTEVLPSGSVQLTATPTVTTALSTAAAGTGSIFLGWSGGGCSGTALICNVNLTANTTVTATFQLQDNSNQLATKIGVFRPSTGEWFLDLNGNGKWDDPADTHITSFPHVAGDLPVVWNTDGASSIGTFNPASGTWKLDTNGNDQWDNTVDNLVNSYGKPGDWPVIRKIAGIGSIIGIYTPVSVTRVNGRRSVKRGLWNFDMNHNSTMDACSLDECDTFRSGFDNYSAERPITGDWNGTGSENIGLFVNGYWYLDLNGNEKWDGARGGDKLLTFGRLGDIPVVGDWDGTRKSKIGVFRPSTGEWFFDLDGNGIFDGCKYDICIGASAIYQQGDLPVVGKW